MGLFCLSCLSICDGCNRDIRQYIPAVSFYCLFMDLLFVNLSLNLLGEAVSLQDIMWEQFSEVCHLLYNEVLYLISFKPASFIKDHLVLVAWDLLFVFFLKKNTHTPQTPWNQFYIYFTSHLWFCKSQLCVFSTFCSPSRAPAFLVFPHKAATPSSLSRSLLFSVLFLTPLWPSWDVVVRACM